MFMTSGTSPAIPAYGLLGHRDISSQPSSPNTATGTVSQHHPTVTAAPWDSQRVKPTGSESNRLLLSASQLGLYTAPLLFSARSTPVLPANLWSAASEHFNTDEPITIVDLKPSTANRDKFPKVKKAFLIQLLPPKSGYEPVGPVSLSDYSRMVERKATYLLKAEVEYANQWSGQTYTFEGVYQGDKEGFDPKHQPELLELKYWSSEGRFSRQPRALIREGKKASSTLNKALRNRKMEGRLRSKIIGRLPNDVFPAMVEPRYHRPPLQGQLTPSEPGPLNFFERSAIDPSFGLTNWVSAPSGSGTENTQSYLTFLPAISSAPIVDDVTGFPMLPSRSTQGSVLYFKDVIKNDENYVALSVKHDGGITAGTNRYLLLYHYTDTETPPELVGAYSTLNDWQGDIYDRLSRAQNSMGWFTYPGRFERWGSIWVNNGDRPEKWESRPVTTTGAPLTTIQKHYDLAPASPMTADEAERPPLHVQWHTLWGTFDSEVFVDPNTREVAIHPTWNSSTPSQDPLPKSRSSDGTLPTAANPPEPFKAMRDYVYRALQQGSNVITAVDGAVELRLSGYDPERYGTQLDREVTFRLVERLKPNATQPEQQEYQDISKTHPQLLRELKTMLFSPWTRIEIQPIEEQVDEA